MNKPVRVRKLSASRLDLASRCLYWAREDLKLPPDDPGVDALKGRAFHSVAAAIIENRGISDTEVSSLVENAAAENGVSAEALAHRIAGWRVQWGTFSPILTKAEVVYVYDPFSCEVRTAPPKDFRRWRQHPREIVTIVDVEGREDGLAHVIDHKTGQQRGSAAEARQLAVAAMCVSKHYPGISRVRVAFHYVDEDGFITEDAAELDSLDLAGLEDELRTMADTTDPEPVPGTHCVEHYCQALAICPHWQRECASLVPEERLLLNLANVADAYDRIQVAKRLLDGYEHAVKDLARQAGGIRLNNGKYYVEREYPGRETVDTKALRHDHPEIASACLRQGEPYKRFVQVKAL